MKKKKNGFLTFCFSCLPGAGQMFLGFTKEGVSLMGIFFGTLALTSWLQLDAVIYLLPVVWFYAFFDALNKNSLSDEEFQQLEDHYLLVDGIEDFKGFPFAKYRTALAIVVILIGANLFFHNLLSILETAGFYVSYELYEILFDYVPQIIISLLIIGAGLYLISGKKNSLDKNASDNKEDFLPDYSDENEGGDD